MRYETLKLLKEEKKRCRKKIVIFGLGKFWESHKDHCYIKKCDIKGYFDNNKEKQGKCINSILVKSANELKNTEYDFILIMTEKTGEIREQLLNLDINRKNILAWDEFIFMQRMINNDLVMAVIGAESFSKMQPSSELFNGYNIEEVFTDDDLVWGNIWGIPVVNIKKIKEKQYDLILVLEDDFEKIKNKIISWGIEKNSILSIHELKKRRQVRFEEKEEICLIESDWCRNSLIIDKLKKHYDVVAIFSRNCDQIGEKIFGLDILPLECMCRFRCNWYVCENDTQRFVKKILEEARIDEKKAVSYEEFLKLPENKFHLLIFGTGVYLKNRLNNRWFDNFQIIAFLDNDKKKWGRKIHNINIISPELGVSQEYDFIVIMSRFYDEMKEQLLKLGVLENNILNFTELCWKFDIGLQREEIPDEKILQESYTPLVSVIIPNYNHAEYLKERLDTVYGQTYKNIEVILLDDDSKDNSRKILDEYADKYREISRKHYNNENSGKAFLQWQKGIELAHGELIWIAESDDYSDIFFLEKMVNEFRRESVMLAFARSVFIKNGQQVWSQEEYLHDLAIDWTRSFVITAHEAVEKGFGEKNIVPNVSSALFRRMEEIDLEIRNYWKNLNLCGDWIFYLSLIKGGCISYVSDIENYYRVHDGSTSLNVQKQYMYFKEQAEVSKYILKNYKSDGKFVERVFKNLKEHYRLNFGEEDKGMVERYYDKGEILKEKEKRMPNIAMCCFGICSGGGETYPLFLANEMKRRNLAVTVFDFGMKNYNSNIRKKLNQSIPLVRLDSLMMLCAYFEHWGIEIAHSHHASVDEIISDCITYNSKQNVKQFITLHGMYEAIDQRDAMRTSKKVLETCSQFVYIADKNLEVFQRNESFVTRRENFKKLPNGLPEIPVYPIDRKKMGIQEDDFVLCLVSRAIREKGWNEAIEAVKIAREKMKHRAIHLLLIGDGEMCDAYRGKTPEFVHVLGAVENVRDYFSMSDVGLLPTFFQGESYPLVVIESLMCGIPVIATDIAEIKNQLMDENGMLAGELLSLTDGRIDVNEVSEVIIKFAENRSYYKLLKSRTLSAAQKFDISNITDSYLELYRLVINRE